jgi:hypothetical protein
VTDAERLLEAGSERERALLRAGIDERPSAGSVRAAARVLGLVPRLAIFAYVVGAVGRSIKWTSVVTYAVAPALVVAGGVAAAVAVAERHAVEATATVDSPAHVDVDVDVPRALVASGNLPRAVEASVPLAEIATPSRARGVARAERKDAAGDVERQIEWIDRARSLAESGDSAAALQAVDQYDRKFPRGALSEEAALVRVEALVARGDRASAAALARRFLVAHPHSVHVAKLQALVGGAD